MQNSLVRCGWCGQDELYVKYHDQEWGKLVTEDKILFEFLVLESAQAGLSWITILRRRENYRKAFANFDVNQVANFNTDDEQRLLNDAGIIRNKLKIKTAISNAQLFLVIQKEYGSFNNYLWTFMPQKTPIMNRFNSFSEFPVRTEISDAISKDMKRRGFKFFGTTICYAFMQAVGMVNDHIVNCSFK